MDKHFDRAYFDRWYRGRRPVISEGTLRRSVSAAVSLTEYFLRRPLRNAIDVGCGEAPWSAHLQALRPGIRYAGFDPSDYAVEQFGASRNVRQGSFGGLGELGIRERFDLLICADVLHYLDEEEIRRGLPVAARLIRGAAFFEVMTAEDDVIGDTLGLRRRPAQWYRDLFTAAGLTQVGPYLWIGDDLRARASPLEL
ncbi:MAG TPA: class I SAM-dependent methyltransferase [Thermoanaerobaculia bacterium]|jgi:SAM-dependent methyltransferase|nr:class I SAM-dependent methyltransferase [Thermoanaerobaculia bacterium]